MPVRPTGPPWRSLSHWELQSWVARHLARPTSMVKLPGKASRGGIPWASEMANKNTKWTNRMNTDELQGSSFLNSDTQCLSACGNRSGWFNPLLSNINSGTHAMGSCCNFCLLSSERINGVGPLILFPISFAKSRNGKKLTWMDTLLETKISMHLDTYPIPARKRVIFLSLPVLKVGYGLVRSLEICINPPSEIGYHLTIFSPKIPQEFRSFSRSPGWGHVADFSLQVPASHWNLQHPSMIYTWIIVRLSTA